MLPPIQLRQTHHFTVDVEEYFHAVALEGVVGRDQWASLESRLERQIDELLALLDASATRATCFTLGWVAERHPDLVRRLSAAGHEIASHGWDHVRVTHQGPDAFRASARRSKALLEDLTGAAVLGFRAPSFSIVPGREWALDILVEEGYRYDSSLFPVRRPDGYGYLGAPRDPYHIGPQPGGLLELPLTTLRVGRMNVPSAGGGYFRLLPYALTRAALHACERRRTPGVFYVHPWELDDGQPRLPVSALTRLRHYGGVSRTRPRLQRLLREFAFRPIADYLSELDARTASARAAGAAARLTVAAAMDPVAP